MMNKALSVLFAACLLLVDFQQTAMSQQDGANAAPIYYLGLTGHFDQNPTYANAGFIIDKVAADSPFLKMWSWETERLQKLRPGDRISSLGDGGMRSFRDLNSQIDQAKHRHGRMQVSVHRSSDRDQEGQMYLIQAQPFATGGYRLGITARSGPNGGALVDQVTAGSPATKMWSETQTERIIFLEPNDEIMSVNGMATADSAAVIGALATSGQNNGVATLKVRNVRTGGLEIFFAKPDSVASGPKVHYVIAGQSSTGEDGFDYGIQIDLENLDELMLHVRHEFVGSSTILQGSQCTSAEIKKAVSSINANPNDTIVVYYSGHGGYDQNGHFLALKGGRFYRKEIAKILTQKSVRLSVFVTDACNGYSGEVPQNQAGLAGAHAFTTDGMTTFESLLMNHRGVIDINAADKDQFGWSDTAIGGYFTFQFAKHLTSSDENPKDWQEAFNAIATNSNAYYVQQRKDAINRGSVGKSMKQQTEMTPEVFQFNTQSAPSGIRVGPRTFKGVGPVTAMR